MLSVINNTIILSYCLMLYMQATLKQLQKQTGLKDVSLRDVPMDKFQFYIGRQHHLAVEVGGQLFELVLNSNPNQQQPASHSSSSSSSSVAATSAIPVHNALPIPRVGPAALGSLLCPALVGF
jgi:hypothetical protein